MNREQKAVALVTTVLVLVIAGLLGGTFYLWNKSRLPALPLSLRQAAQSASSTAIEGTTPAGLYYFDPERDSLVRQPASLPLAQRPENLPALIRLAWERLIEPASLPGLMSPLPPGSAIESVFIDEAAATVYLNLNEAHFRDHPGGTIEEWATIYAAVNTICSLSPSIEQVFFLREGRRIQEGPGGWDYSQSFRPDETLVRSPAGVDPSRE